MKPHLRKHGCRWYCGTPDSKRSHFLAWPGHTIHEAWTRWFCQVGIPASRFRPRTGPWGLG